MGENIGDLSGIAIALKAYHISLGGKTAPVIDGFTGDQRFFLAFAQVWRAKLRDGRIAPADPLESAQSAALSCGRHHAQYRCVVRRIRREAGRQVLPGSRSAREALVSVTRLCAFASTP